MKLCFSTLGCFDKSLEEILVLSKKYNIPAIEVRGINGILQNDLIDVFSEKKIEQTKRLFDRYQTVPLVLGTSCRFHQAEQFDKAIEEGLSSIRIAEAVGFQSIRVFGDRILSDGEACIQRVIDGLTTLCDRAKQVRILLEVHGDFNTIEALSPVIDSMKSKNNFGLIWDIEHTHRNYGSDWITFYRLARPYIKHVHIKDYSNALDRLTLIGQGDVPILPIMDRLLQDGYDGYFSLEWERKWHPELPDIEVALHSFLSLLKEAGRSISTASKPFFTNGTSDV